VSCLGIHLDSNFGWSTHTKSLKSRLQGTIALIHRLRRSGFPPNFLLSVLRALFEPLLSYCIPVWGAANASTLHPLEVCQRNALRAVFGLRYRDSVSEVFKRHNFFTVNKLYIFKVACLSFRSVHGMLSPSMSTHLINTITPLRNDRHLNIPTQVVSTNYLARSPVNQVIAIWNSLPTDLKAEPYYTSFKSILKKYIHNI